MICKKCGANIADGNAFCTNCGAPLTAEAPVQPPVNEAPVAAFTAPEAPAPKKAPKARKRLVGWIIAAAAAVAVIAGVVLSWGYIQNFVDRTFSSPSDYYHKVEKRALKSTTDTLVNPTGITAMYDNMFNMDGEVNSKAIQGSITLLLGEKLTDLISDNTNTDMSWFKSMGLNFVMDRTREDLLGAKATVQLNGTDIVNLDGMYQTDTYMAYFRVPELSEQYAGVNVEEALYDYYWENGYDATFQLMSSLIYGDNGQYQALMSAMPDTETIGNLIDRYVAIVINNLSDVKRGSEKVTAGDVTCTYTTLTVKMDKATLEKIIRDVADEAVNDPDIKDIIYKMANAFDEDADSIYRDFQESLREAVKEDDLLGSDVNAVMVVYVDGTGEVKGRDIRITAGDETVKIRYINAEKGSKFGTDFRVEIPDEFTITVTGGGTKRDDYIKGTLDAKVIADGETRKIATIEIDGNTKDNDFVGDISFIPSEELLDGVLANADLPSEIQDLVRGVKLTLSNHSTKDHLDMALSLSSGSDELLTLQLKSSTADPLDLTVPSSSVDVETWANSISQLNLMALIGNLQEAGIPMSLFSSLAGIS